MHRRLLAGLLLVLVLASCGEAAGEPQSGSAPAPTIAPAEETCETVAKTYQAAVKPILSKWTDATKVAASTARAALAPQISDLQEIRRELDDLTVPECVADTHELLNTSMNGTIDGYLAFMRDDNQVLVNKQMDDATGLMERYIVGVYALARGQAVPTVAPTETAKTFTSAELGKLAFAPGDIADTTAAAAGSPNQPFEKGKAVVYTLQTKGSSGGTATLQAYATDTDAQAMVEQLHDIYSLDTPASTVGDLAYTKIDSSAFQSRFVFSRCNIAVLLELQGNAKNYAISYAFKIDERLMKICP